MQRGDRDRQPDAWTGQSCVTCGTPTRQGAYAALSCPCNQSVTSSLAIDAPRRPCYPRPPCVVCVIVVGELEVRMNPQNLDARLAKRSFHIRTINSSVLAKYVCCRGRPCRDEDVRVCQRCDMCWLMGVGARADRWRNDWLERSSDRPGRVVWLGEQMAAFPSTKIAKPTRCNRTKAAVGRLSRVFPATTAISVSVHALIRMPATRCRTLRTGASRAG